MYSYEDRMRAVKLFIQYDCSFASVSHELGYPNDHKSLKAWYKEFKENQILHESGTRSQKYTAEQRQQAIDYYYAHGCCVSRTVRMLG